MGIATTAQAEDLPTSCSVFLCDDQQSLREAVVHVLSHSPRFRVIGQAPDAAACLAQIDVDATQVVILDINMPGGGPEAARALRSISPDVYILVYTALDSTTARHDMMEAGADAYLLKTGRLAPLMDALAVACGGRSPLA